MTKLSLNRPIAFFDLETTGINISSDRIVEISILKVFPGHDQDLKTRRVNPTIPIPGEVSKIHGIYDKDVKDSPTFQQIAEELKMFLKDCDLAGYNCNYFDIPLLVEEFLRAGVNFDIRDCKVVDVQTIFHKKEERTLSAAYKFYCGKELKNAHSAEADITATFEVLESQLERYPDLINNIDFLSTFTNTRSKRVDLTGRFVYNDKGDIVFNFGKHTGKVAANVFKTEPQYYDWMMKGEFSLQTKRIIIEIINQVKSKQL